jgi:hypothetical protein
LQGQFNYSNYPEHRGDESWNGIGPGAAADSLPPFSAAAAPSPAPPSHHASAYYMQVRSFVFEELEKKSDNFSELLLQKYAKVKLRMRSTPLRRLL